MHHPEHRAEIQHRRDDRGLDDGGIGHVQRLGHDEGDGAHHRRHDLAAHGGGGFDAAGKGGAIAEALHQGNGELAGGHDIGDARAGDRAHQAGGDDRDLGGAALGPADEAERDVGKQLDHAGPLQERAEQDEQEDVGGRDVGRDAVDALGAEGHVIDDLAERVVADDEGRRQEAAEQAIGQEQAGDDRQGRPHDPPGGDEEHGQRGDADDRVGQRRHAGAEDQRLVFPPLIDGNAHAGEAEQPEQRPQPGILALDGGDQRQAEQAQEADMDGPHDLARQVPQMRRRGELEDREGEGDPEQDPPFRAEREARGQGIVVAHGLAVRRQLVMLLQFSRRTLTHLRLLPEACHGRTLHHRLRKATALSGTMASPVKACRRSGRSRPPPAPSRSAPDRWPAGHAPRPVRPATPAPHPPRAWRC